MDNMIQHIAMVIGIILVIALWSSVNLNEIEKINQKLEYLIEENVNG